MIRFFVYCLVILTLCSCQRLRKGYDMVESDFNIAVNGLNTKYPSEGTQDTPLNYPETSPGEHHSSEHSYCYKVLTDILCYTDPQAGKGRLMVGYQVPEYNGNESMNSPFNEPTIHVDEIEEPRLQHTPAATMDSPHMQDGPKSLIGEH